MCPELGNGEKNRRKGWKSGERRGSSGVFLLIEEEKMKSLSLQTANRGGFFRSLEDIELFRYLDVELLKFLNLFTDSMYYGLLKRGVV